MPVSRVVSKLYFAALELLEALEREGVNPVESVADAIHRLGQAIEGCQEETGNGDNDTD